MLQALVGRVTTNRQYRLRTYISRNGLLFMLENAYGTLLHARTGALICILFAVYRRSWLGGTLYKEEIVIRPSNASSTSLPSSLPFSHTHCAQSITNLDTARDHLTHTREPDIAWRSRRAERCLSACWFLAGCNWRPRVPCE